MSSKTGKVTGPTSSALAIGKQALSMLAAERKMSSIREQIFIVFSQIMLLSLNLTSVLVAEQYKNCTKACLHQNEIYFDERMNGFQSKSRIYFCVYFNKGNNMFTVLC